MSRYTRKLKQGKFRYITDEIDRRFDVYQPDWTKYVAVIHKLVADEVEYYKSGSKIPYAEETLDKLSGDCQDQTILASQLFIAAGLDVRIVTLSKMTESQGHVMPQVEVPEINSSRACDLLRKTYEDLFDFRLSKMAWSKVNGDYYFMADPEWCDYIGDRGSLTGKYIEEDGDSWTFHEIRDSWIIEAEDHGNRISTTTQKTSSSKTSAASSRSSSKKGFLDQLDEVADAIADNI